MQSDADLVKAVLEGRRDAYAVLVERYERASRAVAASILRDMHAARDAVQDAFVKAYQKLHLLRDASKFGEWLLKIVKNRALDMTRARPAEVSLETHWGLPAVAGGANTDDASEEVLDAVMRLPKHEQVVVMLRYFDGHDVAAIAEMTNRPIGTVTKQLSRARKRLRKWLSEEGHS